MLSKPAARAATSGSPRSYPTMGSRGQILAAITLAPTLALSKSSLEAKTLLRPTTSPLRLGEGAGRDRIVVVARAEARAAEIQVREAVLDRGSGASVNAGEDLLDAESRLERDHVG